GAGLAAAGAADGQDDPGAAERPAGVRRGRLKQAGVHWCYGGPLEELAALCARLGVAGIDVIHPDAWPILTEHGLVCTITPTMERGFGIARGLNRPEHHEGHLEVIRERIDRNAEAGFENILVFSGNRAEDLSDSEGLEHCATALRQIVGYAEEKGQVIQMELLNSKRDHAGYMFDHTRWGVDLVQKVGSDAFKILYDIYHAQIMEGDVIATIREHHEHFGHYHTAGVPGRRNLDENQELNYPAIMRAIAETGFEGFVGQEFIPEGDKVAALTQAIELCDV
ncbi:MAG: TIM barrel protein, partial [Planctomycetota bacterium]|nr:TIM barrel protein [Planctomycetota bacterium]